MRKRSASILLLSSPLVSRNGPHDVAYCVPSLTLEPLARVDELLKREPVYHTWIAHMHPARRGLVAFPNAVK